MGAIALCRSCRRDTLPQLAQPSWHRDKHRAPQAEREPEPSKAAQKVIRKTRKRELTRKEVRALGMIQTVKLFLAMKAGAVAERSDAPKDTENCPHCLKIQGDAA